MKLTKEQLYYHREFNYKTNDNNGKLNLSGINTFNILGNDTVRVLEIPSHIERVEIEIVDIYSLFTAIDEFPQLKKLILPQKFRELIIEHWYYSYDKYKFTIQQNGSMIYNGNLTFEIVFK